MTPTFVMTGSILAGTAEHRLGGIETSLNVIAPDDGADIAGIIDQAERMCFVLDALERSNTVNRRSSVNGRALEPGSS